ncbi:MAG: ATP-binding protein [Prevotella sp.]
MKAFFKYIIVIAILSATCHNCNNDKRETQVPAGADMLDSISELNGKELYDSAIALAEKTLSSDETDDSIRGMIYAELSASHILKGNMRKSIDYGQKTLQLCGKTLDTETFAILCGNIGIAYRKLGINDSAAIFYKTGVERAASGDDWASLSYLYNNLSVLYCEMERYDESLDFAKKAESCASCAKDTIEMYSARAYIGICYSKAGKYDKAVETLKGVYDAAEKTGSTVLKLKTINYLLSASLKNGNQSIIDSCINRGRQLIKQMPPQSIAVAGIYESLMNVHVAQGKYSQALLESYAIESITEQQVMPLYKLKRIQAYCLDKLGQSKEAYLTERKAAVMQDSVNDKDIKKQLSEYSVAFKTKEKELQITRLGKEKAEQEAAFMTAIYIITGIALLLLAIIIWQIQKRKLAAKQKEIDMTRQYINGMESEKARMARDLHDGACNSLLAISMQLNDNKTERETILHGIRSLRDELRHMSHEMMPPSFADINIDEIIKDYLLHLVKPDNLTIDYTSDDSNWNLFPSEKAYHIYRIIQEAMSNIIRHANATHVTIDMYNKDDKFHLCITDNGKGFVKTSDGVGLKSMKDRTEALGGSIDFIHDETCTKTEVVI